MSRTDTPASPGPGGMPAAQPCPAEMFEMAGRIVCAGGIGGPSWRERARRVLAWVDEPGPLSYATRYADEAVGR
ncbi:hypothetical protein AB0393_27935 [Streptomyces cyaneofuscatus]|uniref:hypothetical protein n=1 Tax=Streptomyces cyaneofuscatus TaxID=66883 RepID=UPI00344C4C87